jgi:iron complex outermembrane receptor protein
VSAYDIELWDEIRNVNVQPFPGAPFTLPRYENIDRSCHTGIAVGADLLLLSDLARRLGFATGGDTLGWRNAYTWSRFVFVDNPTFGGNDLPGALEHYIRSEFRYDHPVGLWVASNLEWAPTSYFVNIENTSRACPLAVDADGRAVIV